jgi:hypothetical protein
MKAFNLNFCFKKSQGMTFELILSSFLHPADI